MKLMYLEIIETIMGTLFATNRGNVLKEIKSLKLDYHMNERTKAFCDSLNSEKDWTVKRIRQIARSNSHMFLLFSFFFPILTDKTMITLNEAISYAEQHFDETKDVFLDQLKETLGLERSCTTKELKQKLDEHPASKWFVSQVIDFPDMAKTVLIQGFDKICSFYKESGLIDENRDAVEKAMRGMKKPDFSDELAEVLHYYLKENVKSIEIVSLQNTMPFTIVHRKDLTVIGTRSLEVKNLFFGQHFASLGLSVLKDLSRLRILKLLSKEELYLDEIAKKLDLTKATVCHHVSMLHNLGFVVSEKRGVRTYFRLNRDNFERFLSILSKELKVSL